MSDDTKKLWDNGSGETPEAEATVEQAFEARFGGDRPIVYIRPVSKQEVEGALPPDAPDGPYFALHDEEGRPLALFSDQDAAWAAARANNFETVSVH